MVTSSEPLAPAEIEALRRRGRHAAAVARTAAQVASKRSLPATLHALAEEILQADGLAGVQVLTNEHSGDKLHMLGTAGFPASRNSSFFSLLMECRRRGADLRMLDVFRTGKPIILPHRYAVVMNSPAWEPLHEYHREPEWDAFASVPITIRQTTIGVLNVFVSPGKEIDSEGFDFLVSMAEQAGLAIDYASLLEQERNAAQREERQQLARDLHDSVVQQVFSMGMLAQTLKVLADNDRTESSDRIQEITTDLVDITGSALKDLRGLIAQLRPSAVSGVGLREAVSKLESATHRQTGVKFETDIAEAVDDIGGEIAEDVYFVFAEAVHNAVKHSSADLISIGIQRDEEGMIDLHINDNGDLTTNLLRDDHGLIAGNGLTFMRQRVERWDGQFEVSIGGSSGGTTIRARIPHREWELDNG
ncbi:GAF domain-containing sensor histidine kinase [Brevibacterium marinum]|uniref:Signal transduction histidine kinase n=1 Tax=Brevibacterium marinum TaxID=418643 RepID=A0A846S461_9MICO|nr:histidine kinase [Brevibacterium marinum]NJC55647.1 signal transduction histidine kinase [Brevibacterium marinum]